MAATSKPDRLDSESTLFEHAQSSSTASEQDAAEEVVVVARPRPTPAKFQTERPRPAVQQLSDLGIQRRATGPSANDYTPENLESKFSPTRDSFDSSSSSETDEDTTSGHNTTERSKHRSHEITSKRFLNSTRQQNPLHRLSVGNQHVKSKGKVSKSDGRLKISVKETANSGYLAKALGTHIQRHLRGPDHDKTAKNQPDRLSGSGDDSKTRDNVSPPRLNIVIMVIGSRGDIQPFLKIGKLLQDKYGHRVRIATHPAFKDFVEKDSGLDFFSVGGDPSELMAFMVKNPGLLPSIDTVLAGEIGKRRDAMYEMFQGFWRACINATDDEKDLHNVKMMGDKSPFIADAIIANPPSFAHFHCAERLGIPLHLMFTFPYTPTQDFPHPLANIKKSNVDSNYTNYMSYPLVDLMTWQGLGDLVNKFRRETLDLEPMSTLWAPGQLSRLKVNFTYLWSPGLVPKPQDWGPEIDIAGYVFLEGASSYEPPDSLSEFLNAGDAIYVGFGSISGIGDPVAFTKMIFEAVEKAGVRALVSKGWGGLGEVDIPENIYMLDSVPHDWLFPRVTAVIHHGGAGTTAMGLKCGKPTLIVPFFGDQPFWASMVARAGAGAEAPIPYKQLTSDKLAEGIKQCLSPEAKEKAADIAKSIAKEGDGAENAIKSFHRGLPLDGPDSLRCSIFPDRVAVWNVHRTNIQLSSLAADLLVDSGRLQWSELRLLRVREWTDFQGPGEPVTGVGGAMVTSIGEIIGTLSSIPMKARKDLRVRHDQKRLKNGKTVASAAVVPGKVAHEVVKQRAKPNQNQEDMAEEIKEVNLQGKAAPSHDSTLVRAVRSHRAIRKQRPQEPYKPLQHGQRRKFDSTLEKDPESRTKTIGRTTAKGVGQSAKTFVKMPLDFYYAMTLGFHNAPRLYGDSTVRPAPHIRGMKSGLTAARDELAYGLADGITGLVRLPYLDAKADGVVGFFKGTGKGIGGLVLKPTAGVLGVGAYFGKGCRAEIRKLAKDTARTDRWIRRARISQGQNDVQTIRSSQRKDGSLELRKSALERLRAQAVTQWKGVSQQRDNPVATDGVANTLSKIKTFSTHQPEKGQPEQDHEQKQFQKSSTR